MQSLAGTGMMDENRRGAGADKGYVLSLPSLGKQAVLIKKTGGRGACKSPADMEQPWKTALFERAAERNTA